MPKIALGTVQFGMHYGITNQLGKTQKNEVEDILEYAWENGIDMLDTASLYGNSEEVLGKVIHNDKDWKIITKVPDLESNTIGSKQVNQLLDSFKYSLRKLKQDSVYGLLLHNCNNIFLPGGERLLKAMQQLKENGLIKKIGVSLYDGEQIDYLLSNYSVDLVQLPINILDQRLIDGGQLKRLKKKKVEIHARSIFLQGLLLSPPESLPLWFKPLLGKLKAFYQEANRRNISAIQLSLGFVQSIKEIDKVVLGVNTLEQLYEVVDFENIYVDTTEFPHLKIDDPILLNPSNWKA
jgi:aryl-alcohol dehydrogenase-like predicted oxidoreductase